MDERQAAMRQETAAVAKAAVANAKKGVLARMRGGKKKRGRALK